MSNVVLVAWGGLVIGLLFGMVGQRTGFCLTSGLRKAWVEGDGRMLRSFLLALGVAVIASHALETAGYVDLADSLYLQRSFPAPLYLAGGVLFGYGMVMANGCGARALVLLGSGNLRSFVVLVCLGIAGHMTLTGLLAEPRLLLAGMGSVTVPLPRPSLAGVGDALIPGGSLGFWLPVVAVGVLIGLYCFAHRGFRESPRLVAGGVVMGLLVAAGWFVTGHLGRDDFDPVNVASLTFIAPVGGAIQYVMLSTGVSLGFGVTVVAGVFAGALAAALASRSWVLEGFPSAPRMARYMAGGALMGVGGALALGCSIGQGLSGMSTLAVGSFVALTGILAGAALALRGPLRLPPV